MSAPRRRKTPARANQQRRRPAPARDFWGVDAPSDELPVITPSEHPTALVRSLGPPPLPGGTVAQHYFDAVYERAAALAIALATAAGLSGPTAPPESTDPAS